MIEGDMSMKKISTIITNAPITEAQSARIRDAVREILEYDGIYTREEIYTADEPVARRPGVFGLDIVLHGKEWNT